MGIIHASVIINKAAQILLDAGNVRWVRPDLFGWVNTGQREAVKLNPSLNAVTSVIQLVAGTKQSLATGSVALIDVVRNMGLNKTTPGVPVSIIERTELDLYQPTWHTGTANAVAQHYIYDPRNPKQFYVYPRQPTGSNVQGSVEIVTGDAPADLADENQPITLDDTHEGTLLDYVLWRAFSKDAEYALLPRATAHLQLFNAGVQGQALGAKAVNAWSNQPPRAEKDRQG